MLASHIASLTARARLLPDDAENQDIAMKRAWL